MHAGYELTTFVVLPIYNFGLLNHALIVAAIVSEFWIITCMRNLMCTLQIVLQWSYGICQLKLHLCLILAY